MVNDIPLDPRSPWNPHGSLSRHRFREPRREAGAHDDLHPAPAACSEKGL